MADVTVNGKTYRQDPGTGGWFAYDAGSGQWTAAQSPDGSGLVATTSSSPWYGSGAQSGGTTGQGGYWVADGDGTMRWVPDGGQQANYKGQGGAPTGGHWVDDGDGTWHWQTDDAARQAPTVSGPGPTGNQPPAPAPPDWRTQQSWWGSLYGTDPLKRTAYDMDPNFAWSTMVNKAGLNSWSPEYDWLQRQQGRMYDIYANQNTQDYGNGTTGNMTFADWIEQNAPTFHNQFQLLSPSAKGYTDYWQPGGRITW